jgi:4'-phosphopantetheinyl transferase
MTRSAPAWTPGPDRPAPPTAPVVDVWRTDLATAPLPGPGDVSAAEAAHAAAGRTDAVRRRRAASRFALRRILARYGDVPATAIALGVGPHGKPHGPAGTVRFNVTHTDELLLVAVSADREVGIDAEHVRPRGDVLALARHGLDDADRTRLAAAPPDARAALFHRLWVRREATVKCHGTGLGAPTPDGPVTLVDADVAPDVPVAIAAAGPGPVAPRWLDLDG